MAIRILHVGVGVRGHHWLDIVRDYADAVSVGCVDPLPAALVRVSGADRQLPCFTSLEEGLKTTRADAAIIATPVGMHMENALQCLEAGLAVLIEKPLAPTVEEASKVVEAGEASGLAVIAAQNYRFNPAERTLRHLVQQGCIGKITAVHCVARRRRPGQGTFLRDMDYAQLIDDAVHHFDSLRSILGCNPVSIVARSSNPGWCDYRHGAITQALIEMEHGIHVQYLGTLTSHRYRFSLWIEGENGVLWSNRKWVLSRAYGRKVFWPMKLVPVPVGDRAPYPREGTTSLLNHIRDAVLHKHMPETNGRDNLWTLAMVDAGVRSDRERHEVDIAALLRPAHAPHQHPAQV